MFADSFISDFFDLFHRYYRQRHCAIKIFFALILSLYFVLAYYIIDIRNENIIHWWFSSNIEHDFYLYEYDNMPYNQSNQLHQLQYHLPLSGIWEYSKDFNGYPYYKRENDDENIKEFVVIKNVASGNINVATLYLFKPKFFVNSAALEDDISCWVVSNSLNNDPMKVSFIHPISDSCSRKMDFGLLHVLKVYYLLCPIDDIWILKIVSLSPSTCPHVIESYKHYKISYIRNSNLMSIDHPTANNITSLYEVDILINHDKNNFIFINHSFDYDSIGSYRYGLIDIFSKWIYNGTYNGYPYYYSSVPQWHQACSGCPKHVYMDMFMYWYHYDNYNSDLSTLIQQSNMQKYQQINLYCWIITQHKNYSEFINSYYPIQTFTKEIIICRNGSNYIMYSNNRHVIKVQLNTIPVVPQYNNDHLSKSFYLFYLFDENSQISQISHGFGGYWYYVASYNNFPVYEHHSHHFVHYLTKGNILLDTTYGKRCWTLGFVSAIVPYPSLPHIRSRILCRNMMILNKFQWKIYYNFSFVVSQHINNDIIMIDETKMKRCFSQTLDIDDYFGVDIVHDPNSFIVWANKSINHDFIIKSFHSTRFRFLEYLFREWRYQNETVNNFPSYTSLVGNLKLIHPFNLSRMFEVNGSGFYPNKCLFDNYCWSYQIKLKKGELDYTLKYPLLCYKSIYGFTIFSSRESTKAIHIDDLYILNRTIEKCAVEMKIKNERDTSERLFCSFQCKTWPSSIMYSISFELMSNKKYIFDNKISNHFLKDNNYGNIDKNYFYSNQITLNISTNHTNEVYYKFSNKLILGLVLRFPTQFKHWDCKYFKGMKFATYTTSSGTNYGINSEKTIISKSFNVSNLVADWGCNFENRIFNKNITNQFQYKCYLK